MYYGGDNRSSDTLMPRQVLFLNCYKHLMICNFTLKINQILCNSTLYFSFIIVFLVFIFKEPSFIRHVFVCKNEIKY